MDEEEEQRSGYAPARSEGETERGLASPRRSATEHELARIELLAGLPGETLARLGQRMEREEVAPGTVLVREGEPDDRFFVLLAGVWPSASAISARAACCVPATTSARWRRRCRSRARRPSRR